jgi:Holliday junction resolvasome RuvABC ATP-dependent DNA helicase subunit
MLIAERSKHTPRLALNIIKRYYRFLRSQTDSPNDAVMLSSIEQLTRYFQINGIGIKGLRRRDWQYLQLLAESTKPLGASLLASQLEVSDQEVKNSIEPHLRYSRLIETTKAGRAITRAGRMLLEEHSARVG